MAPARPPAPDDVAIKDGRIAAIGAIPRSDARDVIDAAGLIVAPGFIDVHTHADDDLADEPRAENFVRMGVTTHRRGQLRFVRARCREERWRASSAPASR